MKVMLLHNRYTQAGGEDAALSLEEDVLKAKGHQAHTVIFQNEKASSGALKKVKDAFHNKRSADKVSSAIDEFKPDIIHIHNWFYEASPSVIDTAYKKGVPVVMTLHNYRLVCANALLLRNNHPCELCVNKTFGYPGVWYKCYHDSAIQSAWVTAITGTHKKRGTWQQKVNTYIVLTEFAKSRFVNSSLNVPPEKMVIKPNFIPDPGEGHQPREDFYLFAGRLSPEKGVNVLLDAFSQLDHKLVVAGDGPVSNAANVSFAGKKNNQELMDLMKRCKALVFPSIWYEGLPFVIVEAFAAGTPVIASNLGSMSELVKHRYNGLHFEPGSATDLRDAIMAFENGGTQTQQMYSNARKTYLDNYSIEQHYRSIISIYESTLAKHGKHA